MIARKKHMYIRSNKVTDKKPPHVPIHILNRICQIRTNISFIWIVNALAIRLIELNQRFACVFALASINQHMFVLFYFIFSHIRFHLANTWFWLQWEAKSLNGKTLTLYSIWIHYKKYIIHLYVSVCVFDMCMYSGFAVFRAEQIEMSSNICFYHSENQLFFIMPFISFRFTALSLSYFPMSFFFAWNSPSKANKIHI